MTAEDEDLTEAAPSAPAEPTDNSLSRLLTLSDGVFAIAMTLLALDLVVPSLHAHATDSDLRRELGKQAGSYFSFALSFYIVGIYWDRHRRLMRSVRATHPALVRDTLVLLLIVAAMPFPASLLGKDGNLPTALAIYGIANVLAGITLMALSRDIRRLGVHADSAEDYVHNIGSWMNLGVFLLCIPAGYVLGSHGPLVLILLAVPGRVALIRRVMNHSGVRALGRRFRHQA